MAADCPHRHALPIRNGNQVVGAGPGGRFAPIIAAMHESKEKESWPRWSTWALIGVIATSLLTVPVTLNDIY